MEIHDDVWDEQDEEVHAEVGGASRKLGIGREIESNPEILVSRDEYEGRENRQVQAVEPVLTRVVEGRHMDMHEEHDEEDVQQGEGPEEKVQITLSINPTQDNLLDRFEGSHNYKFYKYNKRPS